MRKSLPLSLGLTIAYCFFATRTIKAARAADTVFMSGYGCRMTVYATPACTVHRQIHGGITGRAEGHTRTRNPGRVCCSARDTSCRSPRICRQGLLPMYSLMSKSLIPSSRATRCRKRQSNFLWVWTTVSDQLKGAGSNNFSAFILFLAPFATGQTSSSSRFHHIVGKLQDQDDQQE